MKVVPHLEASTIATDSPAGDATSGVYVKVGVAEGVAEGSVTEPPLFTHPDIASAQATNSRTFTARAAANCGPLRDELRR